MADTVQDTPTVGTEGSRETPQMNPSTYKQVRENMRNIAAFADGLANLKFDDITSVLSRIATAIEGLNVLRDFEDAGDMSYEKFIERLQSIITVLGNLDELKGSEISYADLLAYVKKLLDMFGVSYPGSGGNESGGGAGGEGDNSGTGDIVATEDGLQVVGMHTDNSNPDKESTPDAFIHGLSLSVKKAEAIGLSGKPGISPASGYVIVITITNDTDSKEDGDKHEVNPFQVVFCTDRSGFYIRVASDNTKWGGWFAPGGLGAGTVESDTPPDGQAEGDYWLETIK